MENGRWNLINHFIKLIFRHEDEKNQKLDHLDRIEKLKEKLEARKRAATAEVDFTIQSSSSRHSFSDWKRSICERLQKGRLL